jgi:hypothetical protein
MRPTGALFALGLCACRPGFDLEGSSIAVGTTHEVRIDDPDVAEVRDVIDQETGIFEVTDIGETSFTLGAIAPGETEIAVSALTDERELVDQSALYVAEEIADFGFEGRCDVPVPSARILLPPATEATFEWYLVGTSGASLAGIAPLAVEDLVVIAEDPVGHTNTLQTPTSPGGTFAVTSPVYPGTIAAIEVFDPEGLDGLDLSETFGGTITVGGLDLLTTTVLLGGDLVCIEDVERTLTIVGDACSLDRDLVVTEARTTETDFYVYGIASGSCDVTATITGTTAAETLTIVVVG